MNEPKTIVDVDTDADRHNKLALVLRYSGALAAEQHLTEIAKKEGDEAVARVAQTMSAAEITQVVMEADIVKPSLLHTTITAEQFAGVFRRVGATWGAATDTQCPSEIIVGFQEELQQFVCAFILLNEDEKRRVELLGAILDSEMGLDALVFSVAHEKDLREFVVSDARGEAGDWREILTLLRVHFPTLWPIFRQTALLSHTGSTTLTYTHEIAANLYDIAVNEGSVTKQEQTAENDLFTPLT